MLKSLTICLCLVVIIISCNSQPSPKDVTFEFIAAVLDGDTTTILQYLDLERMAERKMKDIVLKDSILNPADFKAEILSELTGLGQTRNQWKNQRILVNKEIVRGDSAEVEMTFIDQFTGTIKYSMVYLHHKDNRWLVYFYK
ncbi:MAG: hypothetical protein B6D58_01260 [candidate division Zixibacteria bacterium 4484_95]|nr:MAG: hypothetical protein B6D58_01260 [candidate division Zixibacteria bacterium 4484_95]